MKTAFETKNYEKKKLTDFFSSENNWFVLEFAVKQVKSKFFFSTIGLSGKLYCKSVKIWKKSGRLRIYVPYSAFEIAGFVSPTPVKGSKLYRGLYLKTTDEIPLTASGFVPLSFRLKNPNLRKKHELLKEELLKKFVDELYEVLEKTELGKLLKRNENLRELTVKASKLPSKP